MKRKEMHVFESSKQHFSSQIDYLSVFLNGFDLKNEIFVIVALEINCFFCILQKPKEQIHLVFGLEALKKLKY